MAVASDSEWLPLLDGIHYFLQQITQLAFSDLRLRPHVPSVDLVCDTVPLSGVMELDTPWNGRRHADTATAVLVRISLMIGVNKSVSISEERTLISSA